jgi:hypothetical protein
MPASKAEIFSVCLRIPMCILEALLTASGTSGAYCEPRTADGKEILGDYTVVWTQKHTPQEMQHLMQTNPAVTGLARLGERRGLRVHVNQAKALHQQVRPDTVFLPNGPKNLYTVGPFPYGVDRQAVAKILQQSGWRAALSSPRPHALAVVQCGQFKQQMTPSIRLWSQPVVKLSSHARNQNSKCQLKVPPR